MTPPNFSSPDALLAWLGESKDADGVAQKLRELGVKGRMAQSCNCPLVNAVRMSGDSEASSDGDHIHLRGEWRLLAYPVRRFTLAFDSGRYPDLIETT